MNDETYNNSLSNILHNTRGDISEIIEFDSHLIKENLPIEEIDESPNHSDNRSKIRKVAAIIAVRSIQNPSTETQSTIGRQMGSPWAQDHRLMALGLPDIHFPDQRGLLGGDILTEKRKVTINGETFEVELEPVGDSWKATVEGETFHI